MMYQDAETGNNISVEILGVAEPYITSAGIPSVRLSVLRVD